MVQFLNLMQNLLPIIAIITIITIITIIDMRIYNLL